MDLIARLKDLERGEIDWREYANAAKGKSVAATAKEAREKLELLKQGLDDQQESIQHDLMCIVDGLDDQQVTAICQVIVDRFKPLKALLE